MYTHLYMDVYKHIYMCHADVDVDMDMDWVVLQIIGSPFRVPTLHSTLK